MIQYIAETFEDADLAGWSGPGWYFWDETQAFCHGPYPDEVTAKTELDLYVLTEIGYEGA